MSRTYQRGSPNCTRVNKQLPGPFGVWGSTELLNFGFSPSIQSATGRGCPARVVFYFYLYLFFLLTRTRTNANRILISSPRCFVRWRMIVNQDQILGWRECDVIFLYQSIKKPWYTVFMRHDRRGRTGNPAVAYGIRFRTNIIDRSSVSFWGSGTLFGFVCYGP